MPVDKFGRLDEAKTSSDGVSLAYISNNFLRKDGTTPAAGSINMNGNTLTRVSNPVNPQDVATKAYVDTNAGLLDENGGFHLKGYLNMGFNKIKNIADPEEPSEAVSKNYVDEAENAFVLGKDGTARGDITMDGFRINNVGSPIETRQVANKHYVDTAVEAITAGNNALTKNQYGTFLATGKIDMNTHQLTGISNPIDRDSAVNKNYADNGGAIVKNPDGSFKAISDIDFKGFTIKNAGNPVDERDLTTKSYVDSKVSLPSLIGPKPIISVHAEEQGDLKAGTYEFAFGNGSSGESHSLGGYCMSAPGRILRGSLMVVKGSGVLREESKVNIVINGVEQHSYSLIKKKGEGCSCTVFPQPLEVDQCDIINFITKRNNPNAKNAYVSILIELDL